MTDTSETTFDFDTETLASPTGERQWQLMVVPHWNINVNPNGGYLLACLLRPMASLVPEHPDPVSVTTHYLRPGLPEKKATLTAGIVRMGRRTATVTGTLEQDGKPRIMTTATFGSVAPNDKQKTERKLSLTPPVLAPPDQCVDRLELTQGVNLPILSRVEVRVDPRYAVAGEAKEATMAGWIRFKDLRPADVMALAVFCDAFPPSIFNLYGMIGWVPTIELTVHVRRRPQTGWVKAQFTTRDVAGELFIEDGVLWDEADELVAQSRQLQMILQ